MEKIVTKFITIFILIGTLVVMMTTNIIVPSKEFSYSERRKLAQFPEIKFSEIVSGDFFEDMEKYLLDQFVFRDFFRKVDSFLRLKMLNQKEVKGVYVIGDGLYKMEYPLSEKSVINISQKIEKIIQEYLQANDIYYAIIPDKNYFVAEKNGYLALDYQKIQNIMQENITNAKYINLFETLEIGDYYRTDIHWRQDKIIDAVNEIFKGFDDDYSVSLEDYAINKLSPFYGTYYGQSPIKIAADELMFLTNEVINQALVYNFYTSKYVGVYDESKINNVDGYDVYLEGAVPLLTIENPLCDNGEELYIFRDSFGSSIAPLFIERYSKIHLIDLRYASIELISEYLDFQAGQKVLFLYSSTIINNSFTFK
ncbi:MAG TPA: DHHW family protein [Bacilli bacterium]|nr:DHHW family protein [Bacilli bacterium]